MKLSTDWRKEIQTIPNLLSIFRIFGSIIYETDESELILQSHFHFRY